MMIPDGGECVGERRTSEEKVGWKDLASKRASSLLKRSDHFSSNWEILESVDVDSTDFLTLAGILSFLDFFSRGGGGGKTRGHY